MCEMKKKNLREISTIKKNLGVATGDNDDFILILIIFLLLL